MVGDRLAVDRDGTRSAIDALDVDSQAIVVGIELRYQRPGKRLDPAVARIQEAHVVAERRGPCPDGSGDDLLEVRPRHEALTPGARDLGRRDAPQLGVVGDHEVPGDAVAEVVDDVLGEVTRLATTLAPEVRLDHPEQTLVGRSRAAARGGSPGTGRASVGRPGRCGLCARPSTSSSPATRAASCFISGSRRWSQCPVRSKKKPSRSSVRASPPSLAARSSSK